MDKGYLRLYAVTDRACLKGASLEDAVYAALSGGATMIQLREKSISDADYICTAKKIKKICEGFNAPLIIDDNVSVAIESGADGVHIGQNDMPLEAARRLMGKDKIIGVTAKTVDQAVAAERGGADYLGCGAVFGTKTKADAVKMSAETLTSITHAVSIPAVAIGGINAENIDGLKNTGIAGVAVVSGIFAAADIRAAAAELLRKAEML